MRGILVLPGILTLAASGFADLQNVSVGGTVALEWDYWTNMVERGDGLRVAPLRHFRRPVSFGPGIYSWASFDSNSDLSVVSQRTQLSLQADFTDNVSSFVEFDSVNTWGEDFRSNYASGIDGRSAESVSLYQAYIEAEALAGTPLRFRVGRQELEFGSGWVLGNNNTGPVPDGWGLSYDALRLGYDGDNFSIDAFWAKLAETGGDFGQGDVDLYGIYGTYLGIEKFTADAYWLYVRDDGPLAHTAGAPVLEALERLLGLDQYGTSNLHTLGLRLAGAWGSFDYDVEGACQFGEADAVGFLFDTLGYGDSDARFDAWGGNAIVGYTFHTAWSPRVYGGFAYLQGQEQAHGDFLDWINPFHEAEASVSFNRLFSDTVYSSFVDGSEMSNLRVYQAGLELAPSERVGLYGMLTRLVADKPYSRSLLPIFTFLHDKNDGDLGWELEAGITYAYSDDVEIGAGYARFFTGKGARQGNFVNSNGLDFLGASGSRDLDYFYWYTELSF